MTQFYSHSKEKWYNKLKDLFQSADCFHDKSFFTSRSIKIGKSWRRKRGIDSKKPFWPFIKLYLPFMPQSSRTHAYRETVLPWNTRLEAASKFRFLSNSKIPSHLNEFHDSPRYFEFKETTLETILPIQISKIHRSTTLNRSQLARHFQSILFKILLDFSRKSFNQN